MKGCLIIVWLPLFVIGVLLPWLALAVGAMLSQEVGIVPGFIVACIMGCSGLWLMVFSLQKIGEGPPN